LGGAALATGGAGALLLGSAEPALAADGFDGYNDVVADFGADPTGASASHTQINNCIQASANPTSGSRKTVYFPPGTYLIKSQLNLPSFSRLVGHGPLSTIAADPTFTQHMLVNSSSSAGNTDISIEDLTLDAGNRSTGLQLIRIWTNTGNHCERIFIRRVQLRKQTSSSISVMLHNVTRSAVEDCLFSELSGTALALLRDSTEVMIEGNLFEKCRADNISLTFAGTAPSGAPKLVTVMGNVCLIDTSSTTQAGSAIAVHGGERLTIVGNVCYSGFRAGIEIDTALAPAQDVEVSNNVIVESGNLPNKDSTGLGGGSGIFVNTANGNAASRIDIANNLITGPSYHGVKLASGASLDEVAIVSNQISWPDQNAGYLQSAGGSGIACDTPGGSVSHIRVAENDIRRALGAGVKVLGSNNHHWDIQANRILDSAKADPKQPGILLDGIDGASVVGNRAQDTRTTKYQQYGFKASNVNGDLVVVGNTFTGNALSGSDDTVISISGTTGSRLRVRDNPGYNPWVGSTDVVINPPTVPFNGSTTVDGVFYWWKEATVSFGVPFPADLVPRVLIATNKQGYAASVTQVTRTGFTCRVWVATTSSSQPSVNETVRCYWTAEAAD
jgi:hypothetical protein